MEERKLEKCPFEDDWKKLISPNWGGNYTVKCNLCQLHWQVAAYSEAVVRRSCSEHLPFCEFIGEMIDYVQTSDWSNFK
jgi:hypothetical protein